MAESRSVENTSFRRLFFVMAALTLASVVWVIWDEAVTRRPWKGYQEQFNTLLIARGEPAQPIRLHQVTIPDLGVVDRCHSCHLGVERTDLDDPEIPLVFQTHPRREELLTPHPPDQYGCTICHSGQGEQTKGVGWADFDHGRSDPYWERAMYTDPFVESSCVACHIDDDPVPGADTYNWGAQLFEDLRCGGCHSTPLIDELPEIAMPFNQLRSKSSQSVLEEVLRDPTVFRPNARMPQFWPQPVDPTTGIALSADDLAYSAWQQQRDQEIRSLVAFIGSVEPAEMVLDLSLDQIEDPDRIESGRGLFDQVGCRACHDVDLPEPDAQDEGITFAPNLARIGDVASPGWLSAWLRQPRDLWPHTRMPDMRLTDEERLDLVAFLTSLREEGSPMLEPSWNQASAELVEAGRDAVQRYGCYGCHPIPGFERAGRVGADLDDFGDKPPDMLAWGEAEVSCDRPELECWTTLKIREPRRVQGQDLILSMPDMRVSEEEALALAVFILAHRNTSIPERYRHRLSDAEQALQAGEREVARANCRGCHEIGRNEVPIYWDDEIVDMDYEPIGGDVLQYFDQPVLGPPPLTFAGRKLQFDWIFNFLSSPFKIRPWLVVRHPSFSFSDEQKHTLIRFFAARNDSPYPFVSESIPELVAEDRAEAIEMFQFMQCTRCHMLSSAAELQPGELSPDLALTANRIRIGWQRDWLLDPQFMQPGTRMPTYFPLMDEDDPESAMTTSPQFLDGDVDRQINALIALTIEFGRGSVQFDQTSESVSED